jgi:anthranilate phosphoribosyltransferase
LDEIALHGESVVAELIGGVVSSRTFSPTDFGAREYPLSAIAGGSAEENAQAITAVLAGSGHPAHAAAVAINAAALLWIGGLVESPAQGYEMAHSILKEGSALRLMEQAAAISRSGL